MRMRPHIPTNAQSASARSRRGFLIGTSALALAGCDHTTLQTQNFRISVEDEFGKPLGSGVWQWEERVPLQQYRENYGLIGEAFPIRHPMHGKMYVTTGSNSGYGDGGGSLHGADILDAYQAAGLAPKFERRAVPFGIGAEGFRLLKKIRTRVELPIKRTPCVVAFQSDSDPSTVRIVMTYSRTRPIEVELRFFVQPTSEPLTAGIWDHLPWVTSDEGRMTMRMRNSGPSEHREVENLNPDEFLFGSKVRVFKDAARRKTP
jgi:hypothetical protein